jgi:hypothetical protein
MIKEINVTTGKIIEREYTEAEEKLSEKTQKEFNNDKVKAEAKATARQVILDRLGLSADELQVLLG